MAPSTESAPCSTRLSVSMCTETPPLPTYTCHAIQRSCAPAPSEDVAPELHAVRHCVHRELLTIY